MEVKGKFKNFDIRTKKHAKQAWKTTAGVEFKDDTCAYYGSMVYRTHGIKLVQPLRGPHITVVNDKFADSSLNTNEFNKMIKSLYGQELTFEVDIENPTTDGKYWWFPVTSAESHMLRYILGLNPEPFFGLHLTIGYPTDKMEEQAKYIHRVLNR